MIQIKRTQHVAQLGLVVRKIDRSHPLRIDPRPHYMSMTSAIFLMEDDGARLIFQAKLLLDSISRVLKDDLRNRSTLWRVQANGEEIILAARPTRDGIPSFELIFKAAADSLRTHLF